MYATIEDMTLAERMKALRTKLDLTQDEMAARLKISRNYYWQLENGTKPGGPKLQRDIELMEVLPVPKRGTASAGDIMRDVKLVQPRFIPVVTLAEAGPALVSWEMLPPEWVDRVATDVTDEKALAIEVRGNSMEPHLREGDRVIIVPSDDVQNGDVVVAHFRNGDTVLKLYHERDKGRTVNLASFNTAYPPTDYRRTEFQAIARVRSVIKQMRSNLFQ